MTDTKDHDLSDQDLAHEIRKLECGVREWGALTQSRARLERLRAIQTQRRGVTVPPKTVQPLVRQKAIQRGARDIELAMGRIEEAMFMLTQGHVSTDHLGDALGLLSRSRAMLQDLGAPVVDEAHQSLPDDKDAYGRDVRYLNAYQHELLVAGCAAQGTIRPGDSESVKLLNKAGLLRIGTVSDNEGRRICYTTPEGRKAVDTWHYHVPTV